MSHGNEKDTPFKQGWAMHLLSIPACWGGHKGRGQWQRCVQRCVVCSQGHGEQRQEAGNSCR